MKRQTRSLLIQAAKAEGVLPKDFLFAVTQEIEELSEATKANKGQYQIYFTDHYEHNGASLYCCRPNKKSAVEERDRLNKDLGPGTTCEYFIRTPGGYLLL